MTLVWLRETYCIGSVNVTYERYRFNQRVQDNGERLDVFMGDVRRLAKTCQFGAVEESLIRDRLVVGVGRDNNRQKLLQIRGLTLKRATDLCKTAESAEQQLRSMTEMEQVHARVPRSGSPGRPRQRCDRKVKVKSNTRQFCGRMHAAERQACPAYGQTCRRCGKVNHFQARCTATMMKMRSQRYRETELCQLEQEEEQEDEFLLKLEQEEEQEEKLLTLEQEEEQEEELLTMDAARKSRWF